MGRPGWPSVPGTYIYIYVMIASSASSLSLVCRKGPAYKPPLEIDHPSPLFNTEVED